MAQLFHLVQKLGEYFFTVVLWVSVSLFIAKTIWNLGVPYAMIHEALRRPQSRHGWSMFFLLDIVLLILAVLASWLSRQSGVLSPMALAVYGLGALAGAFVHLALVLGVSGYLLGLFPENDRRQ